MEIEIVVYILLYSKYLPGYPDNISQGYLIEFDSNVKLKQAIWRINNIYFLF